MNNKEINSQCAELLVRPTYIYHTNNNNILYGYSVYDIHTYVLMYIIYINEIETKISLHRVSCEDHNHQGLT